MELTLVDLTTEVLVKELEALEVVADLAQAHCIDDFLAQAVHLLVDLNLGETSVLGPTDVLFVHFHLALAVFILNVESTVVVDPQDRPRDVAAASPEACLHLHAPLQPQGPWFVTSALRKFDEIPESDETVSVLVELAHELLQILGADADL